jgi:hypothetical protein
VPGCDGHGDPPENCVAFAGDDSNMRANFLAAAIVRNQA